MTIRIVKYTETMTAAVVDFNERLATAGVRLRFPSSPTSPYLPDLPGRTVAQQYYLAVDDGGVVHGGYVLQRRRHCLRGALVDLAVFQLPLSEGIVNRAYAAVGVRLLFDAQQRQPLLLGLGMGGFREALPRLLKASGWELSAVPFFFRIVRPSVFLRNITYLRKSPAAQRLLDLLAASGLGWAGVHVCQRMLRPRVPGYPEVTAEIVDDFGDWAGDLWANFKSCYAMCSYRDLETLRILYPKGDPRFLRLKVSQGPRTIGWAVVLDTPLTGHRQFGSMRLGSIADCFAAPEDAAKVAVRAREYLERRGVDLIVSNQFHAAWGSAMNTAGLLCGPSNFLFAASKPLAKLLREEGVACHEIHMNRGDGDGPINL